MKKLLLDIYYVWINELKLVFRDEAVILLFFVVPFAYPIVYSFIYNNETAHEVKVVVVDDSHSALSREFKRKVDATADVSVIGYATDMEEAREAMRRKEAYGIMYIPADFSRKINTQQQTSVSVYADMSSLLFYKAMLLSATEVSLDMGADIRVAETGGGSQEQDATVRQTVESQWITLYNPQNGFASFLVPAILILIIQQTLLLGIATIVGTHNDKKRFTVASHTADGKNVGAVKLTIGKAFCYASLYMLISVWVLRVIPYLFKFPQIGDPLTIGGIPYAIFAGRYILWYDLILFLFAARVWYAFVRIYQCDIYFYFGYLVAMDSYSRADKGNC